MPLISKTILPHFSSSVIFLYSTSFKPFPIQLNPPFPTIRATTTMSHLKLLIYTFSLVDLYLVLCFYIGTYPIFFNLVLASRCEFHQVLS